jgi:hypothetical protein
MAVPARGRDSTDMIGTQDKRRDVGMSLSTGLTPLIAFNADHEHLRVEQRLRFADDGSRHPDPDLPEVRQRDAQL